MNPKIIKLKKETKPDPGMETIQRLFKPEELGEMRGEHLEGKWLIVNPACRHGDPKLMTRENLLFLASGGFGCNPSAMGTAVSARNFDESDYNRWERYDFAFVFKGELPSDLREFKVTVSRVVEQVMQFRVNAISKIEAEAFAMKTAPTVEFPNATDAVYHVTQVAEVK